MVGEEEAYKRGGKRRHVLYNSSIAEIG